MIWIENQKAITVRETELRYTTNGTPVASNCLVSSEKDSEKAHFIDVVLFGERAENFANEVGKGCLVEIKKGILEQTSYTNRDGINIYKHQIKIIDFELVRDFQAEREEKEKQEKNKNKNNKANNKGGSSSNNRRSASRNSR